jgi:hypothetical protein
MLAYIVQTTFEDPAVADEWAKWLVESGHLADVCKGGALWAEVVRVDGPPTRVQVHLRFESRETYAQYEAGPAAALRADAARLFSKERGVTFLRTTGHIEARVEPPKG